MQRVLLSLVAVVSFVLLACPGNKSISAPSPVKDSVEKIIGADISFLPQLEDEGIRFSVKGKTGDAFSILKQHGFNYIRLRIFNNPQADSGYSAKGYCGLEQTKKMAKRIKAAGMKFLLDFHYSDTWADPGKQYKPEAWKNLSFQQLNTALHDYTKQVLLALQQQGTLPDMVQVGNEVNHGILWPDGNIVNLDTLASFLNAGLKAVKEVSPNIKTMLHIANGGENEKSRYFLDNMLSRNVVFDIIGQSYYPQWHGTLADLQSNLTDLNNRYPRPIVVVEYTAHKQEVNDIAFGVQKGLVKGTFIWEPLNTWEFIFDKQGRAIDSLLNIYPALAKKYQVK
ncbi:glycoside hydrolase family 53 protein [Foetidibacter luteolus]|uniref:glycoside hydrolase family 53 protein n=1 Tax=Foetidibacter luteolus TaxID=2608880 RepID=UPI001A9A17B6|nr:glycosyl hydrolase 53 family protein [Foetidibacter luteolus]